MAALFRVLLLAGSALAFSGLADTGSNWLVEAANDFTCYVGILTSVQGKSYGNTVYCTGQCATATTLISGQNTTAFFCMNSAVCDQLSLANNCSQLIQDNDITACCCNSGNNCNANGYIPPAQQPPVQPFSDPPIACYTGLWVNGQMQAEGPYQSCQGDCVSITINTTVNQNPHVATFYTCDPSTYCRNYNISGSCSVIQDGMSGCCCSTDVCIDPTRGRTPINKLTCYVGLQTTYLGKTYGSTVYCDGKCASATAVLAGFQTTSFFCVDKSVCSTLGLDNTCAPFPGDKDINGCCCDNAQACNVAQAGLSNQITIPPVTNSTDPRIACYAGVWVNGAPLSDGTFVACQGDCASIQLDTQMNGQSHTATLYTCDPSTYCRNFDMMNKCSQIEPGMTGCCCNTDSCIDPTRGKSPAGALTCYVGLQTTFPNKTYGSTVYCNGKCGSAQATLFGYNTTTFFCLDPGVCSVLGLDNSCGPFPGDKDINGCCCDNAPTCNVAQAGFTPDQIPAPPVTNSTDPRIACYAGVWVNGAPLTDGTFQACQGDCVSIQLNTSMAGKSHIATLYTCDPSTYCRQFDMLNKCNKIEDGMTGCCCNTDSCIDPTRNRSPDNPLTCYVGLQTSFPNKTYGSNVFCNGKCGSAQAMFNGYNSTAFFCLDTGICASLNLDNSCGPFPEDKDLTGCCCDNGPACNVALAGFDSTQISIPPATPYNDPLIACYAGVWVNGMPLADGTYTTCQGDCVSIQMDTQLNGRNHTATLYTCDSSTYCRNFDILNKCSPIQPGMTGCCCSGDVCIDPTKGRSPADPLTCFAGVYVKEDGYTTGDDVFCDGKCASILTTVSNKTVKVYQCVRKDVCTDGLQIDGDGCTSFPSGNATVTACCCDYGNNCNSANDNLTGVIPTVNWTSSTPLACWSGFYKNGVAQGNPGWANCRGDCASFQWKTSGSSDTMTLYTCDPIQFLQQINVENHCGPVDNLSGLKVCSCSTTGCLDGTSNVPNTQQQLTCYVGLQTSVPNKSYGSTVNCNGKCGSATTTINGQASTSFFCLDNSICSSLGLNNKCLPLPADKEVTGCCCDNSNNCNIAQANMTFSAPQVANNTDAPIACYAGIWINGQPYSSGTYQSCQGDCVSITLDTAANGQNHTATIYTCDPSTYCRNYDILGKCSQIEPGMTGCCCNTDVCIDPTRGRTPIDKLTCYVGLQSTMANKTYGSTVYCDGKCGSATATLAGQNTTSFFCLDKSVCSTLGLDNSCLPLPGDKDVLGCCCDNGAACNVAQAGFTTAQIQVPNVTVSTDPRIACYAGAWVDGKPLADGTFTSCQGDCVSITLNTTVAGAQHTATLYTCDPSTYCRNFDILNKCSQIEPGMTGCCCNTDSCIDPTRNRSPDNPLTCYVGLQTTFPNKTYGSTVYCNGKCGSAQAMFNGYNSTAFFCLDTGICASLNLDKSCGPFPGDKDLTGCCCDNGPACNVALAGFTPDQIKVPPVVPYDDPLIACYAGVWVNGAPLADGVYTPCLGDCVSIQLDTTMNQQNHTATLYTCDPSSYCRQFDILDKCSPIEPGMTGCCCRSDVCIDPTKNRSPGTPLQCFAGVSVPADNYTQGATVGCDGKCLSVETMVSNKTTRIYQCVRTEICRDGLGIDDNGCSTFKEGGSDVKACCCDDSANCNSKKDNLNYVMPVSNATNTSIACWSGFYRNGKAQDKPTWMNCNGDCTSFQWKYSNSSDTMTLYTCDPVSFIQQLNVDNACGQVDNNLEGLKVCSCSYTGCMDGSSNAPITTPTSVTCPSPASRSDLWSFVSAFLLTVLYRFQ